MTKTLTPLGNEWSENTLADVEEFDCNPALTRFFASGQKPPESNRGPHDYEDVPRIDRAYVWHTGETSVNPLG